MSTPRIYDLGKVHSAYLAQGKVIGLLVVVQKALEALDGLESEASAIEAAIEILATCDDKLAGAISEAEHSAEVRQ